MKTAKRRMTATEFEAVRPLLNISENRINAARAAMVEGQTLQSVATVYGWTRQAVDKAVAVVWRTRDRYQQAQHSGMNAGVLLPPGWEQVTMIAPSSLIQQFRAEVANAVQSQPDDAKVNKKPGAGKHRAKHQS